MKHYMIIIMSCPLIMIMSSYTSSAPPQAPAALTSDDEIRDLFDQASNACNKKDGDLAILCCNRILKLDPNQGAAYINRACAHHIKGQFDKAISDANTALTYDLPAEQRCVAFNNRGLAYRVKKNDVKAIEDFTEAIRLDPKFADAYLNRGNVYSAKEHFDLAIEDYSNAIQSDPKLALAYNGRGWAYHGNKDYDKALKDYNEAIRLDPKLAWAYTYRGMVKRRKQEYDRAIQDFNEAIRLDPENTWAYFNRAITHESKKNYDKALNDCSEAIRLDPKNALAYNERAWLMATCPEEKYRNGKKALENAKKAHALEPEDPDIMATLGAAFAECDRYDEAVLWIKKALKARKNANDDGGKIDRLLLKLYEKHKPYRQGMENEK